MANAVVASLRTPSGVMASVSGARGLVAIDRTYSALEVPCTVSIVRTRLTTHFDLSSANQSANVHPIPAPRTGASAEYADRFPQEH
jgi:hypothetical protein